MNSLTRISLAIFLISLHCHSAQASDPEIKFGKVKRKHLQMDHYKPDANAGAVILADMGKSYFDYDQVKGFQVVFERHVRIKILNKNGYDWANGEILVYHDKGDKEKVTDLKGLTHNLVEGQVVTEKLKKDGIFTEEFSSHWDKVKFAMPGVKPGSVIEYSYKVESDFKTLLRDWEFQKSIPVVWSEYEVEIPEYFQYLTIAQGYEPFVVNETRRGSGYFTYTSKNDPERHRFNGSRNIGQPARSVHYNTTIMRWAAEKVPAIKPEKYISTVEDYLLKMEFQLATIHFPGSMPDDILGSWKEVEQKLIKSPRFGRSIRKYDFLEEELSEIASEAQTPEETMKMIHTYISDNFRWDETTGLMAEDIEKAFRRGKGSAAEINLLLIAMLRQAGLQADPVIISTRENGRIHPVYPIIGKFNYVIGRATINGRTYWLDATEPILPCGMLPARCLSRKGRLISESTPGWVEINPEEKYSRSTTAKFKIDPEGRMEGVLDIRSDGYGSLVKREILQKFSKRSYIGTVKRIEPTWSIQDFLVSNVFDFSSPLHEKYTIAIEEFVPGSEIIYLNPIVVDREVENPFLMQDRDYPVDLEYPEQLVYSATFFIPEGFHVEDMPESMSKTLPGNAASFDYIVSAQDDSLTITSKISIEKELFLPNEYTALQQFYDHIIAKHAEQVVLKRTSYERQ